MTAAKKPKILAWRLWLCAALVVVLVLVSVALLWGRDNPPVNHEELLGHTEKVVLVTYHPEKAETVLLEDESTIREFTGKMRLVPKKPCACSFVEHLEFHTPRGIVRVFMTPECVHVGYKGKGAAYWMPEGLWELYQAHRTSKIDIKE